MTRYEELLGFSRKRGRGGLTLAERRELETLRLGRASADRERILELARKVRPIKIDVSETGISITYRDADYLGPWPHD